MKEESEVTPQQEEEPVEVETLEQEVSQVKKTTEEVKHSSGIVGLSGELAM